MLVALALCRWVLRCESAGGFDTVRVLVGLHCESAGGYGTVRVPVALAL